MSDFNKHCEYKDGNLYRKIGIGGFSKGSKMGYPDRLGRWYVGINKKVFCLSHIIWAIHNGSLPEKGMTIDHIDGDFTNNKIENLRCVDQKENNKNKPRYRSNKTGVSGVQCRETVFPRRYFVRCGSVSLGGFSDFFEACCARKSAENKYGYHKNNGR